MLRPIDPVGCNTTSEIAVAADAVLGVNGGFFCMGSYSLCSPEGAACARACEDVGLVTIDHQNKAPNCQNPDDVARTALGLADGPAKQQILWTKAVKPLQSWREPEFALGAGPNLVSDGVVDAANQGFPWMDEAAPRTAIGFSDQTIFLVVVDGRNDNATGMTIAQLAEFMVSLGAVDAMNLDGGGSSTLFIRGFGVVNAPSDGRERPVGNGLFLFQREEAGGRSDK